MGPATAASSLGLELGLGEVGEDELDAALDGLFERQGAIETALAKRHLTGGTLVLYEVSSSYGEGRRRPLANATTTGTATGQGADRLRLVVRRRRLPDRHRGVRRQ